MSDFPDEVWIGSDDEMGAIHLEEDESLLVHYDDARKYIRADLVTQWQPIDTLTTNERVIVLFDSDHIDSGWLDNVDERRFFRTGHGKLPLTRLTHWMPIPKVPE